MQKIRTRLVNFRVTEEEFAHLKSACDRQGARCLSEFARQIMLSSEVVEPEDVNHQIVTLRHRVAILESSLTNVISLLSALKPEPAAADPSDVLSQCASS